MQRLKSMVITILLCGSVVLGLAACQDQGTDQRRGERSGAGDAARGPGSPANPGNPQGPSGPPAEKGPSR
jgi:hypothetical protein